MVSQYYDFLDHYKRSYSPLTINPEYLVKAHFHQEVGRGGYFAPESGTSEAQFLAIRGALDMFGVSKDIKWLNLAEELMQSALKHLYKGQPIPDVVDEDNLWLPHWLYNASEPFVAESYYLYHKANFTNGVGTIYSEYKMREVFTVRSIDAKLEWENPYSDIIGKEYKVKGYTMKDNSATITLDEEYTGEAYVVYADLGGPTIEHNEMYEAWPIWRKLNDGETACAVDSLWWAYDSFKLLAEYTGKPQYEKGRQFTLDTIVEVMKVSNMNDWHCVDFKNDDVYSANIGLYTWQNRNPEATFSRDKKDGSAVITIPRGEGQVQYGKGGIDLTMEAHNSVEIKVASDVDTKFTAFISPVAEGTMDQRYTAHIKLKGGNVARKFTLRHEDFVQTTNLFWDLYFLPSYTDEDIYTSEHSKIGLSIVEDPKGREWRKVNFILGTETDGEYEFKGYSQYQPIINKELFDFNSIPPFHMRLTNGEVNLRITDSKGYYWETPVPTSTSFKTFQPAESDFVLSSYQSVSGIPSSMSYPLKEFVFDSQESSTMEIKYIGEMKQIPVGTNINDFVLNFESEQAQTVKIYYSRPLPLEGYAYTPYVAPFTVNTVNNRIDTWRGTPYTGYQCPWIWQEAGIHEGVETVLDFLEEAQNEYTRQVGVEGFFMPLLIWDRWDSREYGEPNTFTWNGPDPNTHWGGFQYRVIETVARTYYNEPTNTKAKNITWKFIKAVDKIWTETGHYPTTFNKGEKPYGDYEEPHIMSLFLRTLIFYYQTTPSTAEQSTCKRLIGQTIQRVLKAFNPFTDDMKWNTDFINGTWSTQNDEWYMFWGGEILSAMALLMKYCKSEFCIKTRYGSMVIETLPNIADVEDYVKVKTPIGVQKAVLVEEGHSDSSPLKVKTTKGIMSLGGTKMSAGINKEVLLLIRNEGNAMKDAGDVLGTATFEDAVDGAYKICRIMGKSVENCSPRKSYDYSENNWDNVFEVSPGKDLAFRFEITQPFNTTMTMVFKDAEGRDFGWEDIGSMAEKKTVYYTKKVPANAKQMVLYCQTQGPLVIDEIMILYGDYSTKPMPPYFEGTIHSCPVKNSVSLQFRVLKDGKIIDSLELVDVVPEEYLPLKSVDGVYDEIVGNVLYKRIGDDDTVLPEEQVILLNQPIAFLECHKGSSIQTIAPNNQFPNMEVKYPVEMSKYIKELMSK